MAMCRACGDHPGDQSRLRENLQKYFDIYFNLTSIRLKPDEDPDRQRICDDCHLKLLEYNRFRSVCLQVHYRLTEIKTEIDYDPSGFVTVECKPLLGSLKVESLESPGDDLEELGFKDDILNDDEDAKLKDEESVQLLSEMDNARDEDFKEPKKQKRKKKIKGEEELLGCNLCEKKFRTDKRLQGHLRAHQGLKAAVCSLCGEEFQNFYRLKLHRKGQHSDAKNEFPCDFPECGSSYSTKQRLDDHRKRHDPIVCGQCGKTCSTAAALKSHSYVHSGDKPFQCQICNKKFLTTLQLKEHTNRHEGIRSHVCHYCGLKKTTLNELKVHINSHTKEKQHTCHVCAHVFFSSGNLSHHIKVVHKGIKAYNCTYCGRSFGKSEHLKNHVMTHTGEKPHECKVCGKRFTKSSGLHTHMKTHQKFEETQLNQRHSLSLLQSAMGPMVALAHPQQQQSPDGST